METQVAQQGMKCYPLQLAVGMEEFIRKVAKAKLNTTTDAELDAIHISAKFLEWRLNDRA